MNSVDENQKEEIGEQAPGAEDKMDRQARFWASFFAGVCVANFGWMLPTAMASGGWSVVGVVALGIATVVLTLTASCSTTEKGGSK